MASTSEPIAWTCALALEPLVFSRTLEIASSWIHMANSRLFASSISVAALRRKAVFTNAVAPMLARNTFLFKHRDGDSRSHGFLINHLLFQMRLFSLSFQFLLSIKLPPRLVVFLFLNREHVVFVWFDLSCSLSPSSTLSGFVFLEPVRQDTSAGGPSWSNKSVQTPSGTCPFYNTCSNWLDTRFS